MPDFIKYRPSCSSAGLSGSLFDASEHDDKIKNCAHCREVPDMNALAMLRRSANDISPRQQKELLP